MEKIVYSENSKDVLKEMNIQVSGLSKIETGAVLYSGCAVLGESVVKQGAVIGANSVVENSVVEENAEIQSSFVENSVVGEKSKVGPFAHIREKSFVGKNCRIGNFVEIKNSLVGDNTNIAHLTYVGDACVGKNCNIGCGVVFCNFNGETKNKIVVGDNVFVGSNVNLIAPVSVDKGAFIAAGSTINKNVATNEFAIARARQENKTGFDNPYKRRLKSKKLIK